MKKYVILLTIFAAFSVTGCKSNEEKANELIRAELSKSLYDFDSYQPVETIVKEAKNTAFNNEKCWQWASLANLYLDECHKHIESSKQAQEYMEIYTPSYYSSSRSDRKFYKYKKEAEDYLDKAKECITKSLMATDSLKSMKLKLDTTQVIGWEVSHKFRCKTKGGYATIGNYKYVIDEKFENILFHIDLDTDEYKKNMSVLNVPTGE